MFCAYYNLLVRQGIDISFVQEMFHILGQRNGKRNTIYLYGCANGGKTAFLELFSSLYHPFECGRLSPQGNESVFWLQDLYLKRLFMADEILVTQKNIDSIKLLMEGNNNLSTDTKYGKKQRIKPRPVLMASNDPIWVNFSTAYQPITAR